MQTLGKQSWSYGFGDDGLHSSCDISSLISIICSSLMDFFSLALGEDERRGLHGKTKTAILYWKG